MDKTVIRHDERSYWSSGYLYCSRCNWHSKKMNALQKWRWHMFRKHR